MKQSRIKQVALTGLLFALAIVLSYIEGLVPALPGAPPGIKLGLSNVAVMYCLYFIGVVYAFGIIFLKFLFAFIVRGAVAGIMSLAGGLISCAVMYIMLCIGKKNLSIIFISAISAVSHNLSQCAVAYFIVGKTVLLYIPVLIVSGLIMGLITGVTMRILIPPFERINTFREGNYKGKYK